MQSKPKADIRTTSPKADACRDFALSLEQHGYLKRIPKIDQDQHQSTALAYKLLDSFGYQRTPAFLMEQIKVDGQWLDGPVIGNLYSSYYAEALAFGVTPLSHDPFAMYQQVKEKLRLRWKDDGYQGIEPVDVDADSAPVKTHTHTGGDIDLTRFAFLKTNPVDAGRYINMGTLFMRDQELGEKIGIYRAQIKGPNKLVINPEPGQGGWKYLMALKKRGVKTAKCAIILGVDPITFSVAAAKLGRPDCSELAVAGGLRGRALELVRCHTSNIRVPANAEMIIEGEIPLNESEEEGPFAEFFNVIGDKKKNNFIINVTAISHREKPWLLNAYSGVTRNAFMTPREVALTESYRRTLPELLDIHVPQQAAGVNILQVNKISEEQPLEYGTAYAEAEILAKVVIVVSEETNIHSLDDVFSTIGARWQPAVASNIIDNIRATFLDPSVQVRAETSKIVIDATPRWRNQTPIVEGLKSRQMLEQHAPHSFDGLDQLIDQHFKDSET